MVFNKTISIYKKEHVGIADLSGYFCTLFAVKCLFWLNGANPMTSIKFLKAEWVQNCLEVHLLNLLLQSKFNYVIFLKELRTNLAFLRKYLLIGLTPLQDQTFSLLVRHLRPTILIFILLLLIIVLEASSDHDKNWLLCYLNYSFVLLVQK